jgi:hypothetical protein
MVEAGMLALMLGAGAPAVHGQVMRGHLVDDSTELPIEAARIVLLGSEGETIDAAMTDSAGYFSVAGGEAGEYRLTAGRIGYPQTVSSPLSLAFGDTLQVEFRISAGVVLLDPVIVTGRRRRPPADIRAFYRRAESGIFGTFLTRTDIERAHPVRSSDLLRTIPGVQVVPMALGGAATLIRGCRPLIVVDGVRVQNVTSIDHLVQPLELEGLEVYRSPSQVPVEYGGLRSNCGAILIWTRRGD